jgi:hypothetical protein
LHIPFVPSYHSFHIPVREASGNALQNFVRENWRLAVRSEWSVASDSLDENRTEKNPVS